MFLLLTQLISIRDCLRFALKYCPISCMKNRQRILVSLIPVEVSY